MEILIRYIHGLNFACYREVKRLMVDFKDVIGEKYQFRVLFEEITF